MILQISVHKFKKNYEKRKILIKFTFLYLTLAGNHSYVLKGQCQYYIIIIINKYILKFY